MKLYVRHGRGPRISLDSPYGSKEFWDEYAAAMSGAAKPSPMRTPFIKERDTGTFAWLVRNYERSSAWDELKPETQKQRRYIFAPMIVSAGKAPLSDFTKQAIIDARERRKDTPFQANKTIRILRSLFQWGIENNLVEFDPTEGVKLLSIAGRPGFHTWTEDEIERYEARWPLGTRERLAFDVLLYTGFRRHDAVSLKHSDIEDGIISIITQKTDTPLSIPLLEGLRESIAAGPCGSSTVIATEKGKPHGSDNSFGTWFGRAIKAAGVDGSSHGLRKAAAVRFAEAGATESQLMAWFGWQKADMATLYTRKANRAKMAKEAAKTLLESRT